MLTNQIHNDPVFPEITEFSLAGELETVKQELAAVKKSSESFSGLIAHDLLAPLRAISGFLDLLNRKYEGNLDEKAIQYIGFAVDSAERMKRLINDLRLYTTLQYSAEEFVPTNLNDILLEAWKEWDAVLKSSAVKLSHDPLPELNIRHGQFLLLFRELTSNALKFNTSDTPSLHVSASIDEKGCTIRFSDNGIGFNPDFSEKIFQLFRRLHPDEKKFTGMGTGLAVCSKIAELHGGRMGVESAPGSGSRFWIFIPGIQKLNI